MGNGPLVMTGPRAIVSIQGENGKSLQVGIFNSVSYSVGISIQPVEVLGNFLPSELAQVGQDAAQVTCSGFRVLNAGPYVDSKVPTVSELLKYDGILINIVDRQSGTPIMNIGNAKCTGYRTTHNAKGLSDLEVTYIGIVLSDEATSANNAGKMTDVGAAVFPTATPATA